MRKEDIAFIRGNFAVGEKAKVPKMVSNDKSMIVEAEILGKYPHIMLVTDGLYK